MSRSESLVPAREAVDHLLLGVSDLDHGAAWIERLTGVRPAVGGSHPGRGTRNALISMGGRRYLEVIAPDPLQTANDFIADLRRLSEPRLITWAAASTDINATAKSALGIGSQALIPRDGSRAKQDGKMLKWRVLEVPNEFALGVVEPIPFFIEWAADSLHPSQDSPAGCELLSFEIEHPEADGVAGMLKRLGVEVKVKRAKGARLRATLRTPKGKVELS